MTETIWAICTRHAMSRTLKTEPTGLKASEYAFKLKIDVPDSIFVKAPAPVVSVTLTPDAVPAAAVTVGGQPQEQFRERAGFQAGRSAGGAGRDADARPPFAGRGDAGAFQDHSKTILGALIDAGADVRLTVEADPAFADDGSEMDPDESEAGE